MSATELEVHDPAPAPVVVEPRLTIDQIETSIIRERYFVDETCVICVMTTRNGRKTGGWTYNNDPATFDEEFGRKLARDKAIEGHLNWRPLRVGMLP